MNSRFPYGINVAWSAEDDAYVADVPALRSCSAHGDSVEEAVREAVEAARSIIEVLAEDGKEAPPPDVRHLPSGRLLLRLPRSLHAALIDVAKADGVSLNQEIAALLAAALGARTCSPSPVGPRLGLVESMNPAGSGLPWSGAVMPLTRQTGEAFRSPGPVFWDVKPDPDNPSDAQPSSLRRSRRTPKPR